MASKIGPVMKRAKRAAPTRRHEGAGVFSRVVPAAPSNVPEDLPPSIKWSGFRGHVSSPLGAVPTSTFDRLRERQAENLRRQLETLDLDPAVAAEVASIDPDGSYVMVATVRGYNGNTRSKDLTFAGRGRALWERVAWLAGSDEVEIVEIYFVELQAFGDGYQGSYALWKRDAVITADGLRFEGIGDFTYWRRKRDERVGGRPKKRRGRLSYEEGTRAAKAQRQADRRARATKAKIRELNKRAQSLDDSGARGLAATLRAEARKLDRRADAARGKKKKGKR